MWYGRTGTDLEIDLSKGNIEKKEGDPKIAEAYLGGKGTIAKLFWDRVPHDLDPFSPDNLLVFGTGILDGTIVPSANRTTVSTRSPQTNLLCYSNFGGFWGPELKHAGYDTIIITGKSPTPVYLWINDDYVEIRDASHLWGKETSEAQRMIKEELKRKEAQIACIGPAGENKVYGATIEHSSGASASRGVGVVMGDKNLKAIAVYGTKDVNTAKPAELMELCNRIIKERTDLTRSWWHDFWAEKFSPGFMLFGTYGNLEGKIPADLDLEKTGEMHRDYIKNHQERDISCYNCGIRCKRSFPSSTGGYNYVKCCSLYPFMVTCKIHDYKFGMECYNLCEKYGLDHFSLSQYVAFAIDLYQKGILTKEDTEGMHLEFGNKEVAYSLIKKIVRREGIGDVLANGVHEAARIIGKGAEEYAHTTKKLELVPLDHSFSVYALCTAVGERPDLTRLTGWYIDELPYTEDKEKFIESDYFPYPKEYGKYIKEDFDWSNTNVEGVCKCIAYNGDMYTIGDITGICYWAMGFLPYPPISNLATIADLISCAIGRDIDEPELLKIAGRIGTLIRSYNVRLGIKRKDDTIPKRYFQDYTPPEPLVAWDHDKFNKMIDEYYKIKGWNNEGIPTKERLDKLGLDDVKQDLEQRGILTD